VSKVLEQQMADLRRIRTPVPQAFTAFLQAENDRAKAITQLLGGVRPHLLRLAESLASGESQLGRQARQAAAAWGAAAIELRAVLRDPLARCVRDLRARSFQSRR
jgi:hypothetical protein